MKGKMKLGVLLVFCLVAMFAISGVASALPTVDYVEINDNRFEDGDSLVIEKGEEIEIEVKLQAENESYEDLEIEADIIGYEYNDNDEISDSTHTFDMDAGDTMFKDLSVTIPADAEKDIYDLRLRIAGRTGPSVENTYRLRIEGGRHNLDIKNILLHPANSVEAGSYLLVNARVINRGENTEEDVRVTASIPALNLEDSYYIDEIEEDESRTSEELFLRIPACARADVYEVEVEVEFDEGHETITETDTIEVLESDLCRDGDDEQAETIISVGSQVQQLTAGEGGATYSIAITNPADRDKTYTVSVSGIENWGTYRVDPATTVLVKSGQTKPVFVFVSANDDAGEGQQSFVATIASGSDSETVQFYANVESDDDSVRQWAEYVLIALVVLLIILGLIIGFSRFRSKGNEGDEDEELTGQTYY